MGFLVIVNEVVVIFLRKFSRVTIHFGMLEFGIVLDVPRSRAIRLPFKNGRVFPKKTMREQYFWVSQAIILI